jgi:hypothetical protein
MLDAVPAPPAPGFVAPFTPTAFVPPPPPPLKPVAVPPARP